MLLINFLHQDINMIYDMEFCHSRQHVQHAQAPSTFENSVWYMNRESLKSSYTQKKHLKLFSFSVNVKPCPKLFDHKEICEPEQSYSRICWVKLQTLTKSNPSEP